MKVYDQAREASILSIDERITVLRAWIAKGIPWRVDASGKELRDDSGDQVPEFIPSGVGEFCEWSAADHSSAIALERYVYEDKFAIIGEFRTLHRNTLNQTYHKERKELAKRLMKTLGEVLTRQLEAANKSLIIDTLRAEIKYLRLVITAQEVELKTARANERKAISEKREEGLLRLRNESQLKRDNDQLGLKVSELTRQLAQLAPLAAAKGSKK